MTNTLRKGKQMSNAQLCQHLGPRQVFTGACLHLHVTSDIQKWHHLHTLNASWTLEKATESTKMHTIWLCMFLAFQWGMKHIHKTSLNYTFGHLYVTKPGIL